MNGYAEVQRMRETDCGGGDAHGGGTAYPAPMVLPGMRTGAHAGRVPIRRAIAAARLAAAGTVGGCAAAVAMAGWAIPAAWAARGYPAAGGEWVAIIVAAIAGWWAVVGSAALVLRMRRERCEKGE